MSRRRRKIVTVVPSEYTVPDKPCEVCDGEGKILGDPSTGTMDGQVVTMCLSETCPACKGAGVSSGRVLA